MKRNVPLFGFLLGVIAPMIGMLIVYLVLTRGNVPFGGFIEDLMHDHRRASMVLSLSLLAEVVPFIYFTNKRLDLSARGVLVATVLYALFIIWIKYVAN